MQSTRSLLAQVGFSAAVLIATGGCARSAVASRPAATVPEAWVCTDALMQALRDTVEERHIREAGGRVQRIGCELRIALSDGHPAIFRNDLREGDQWRTYWYAGVVPGLGIEVVEVGYYEGGYLLLLSPTGRSVAVAGNPVVAPDSSAFFTTSLDLEAEYDPNVIEVWAMQSGSPRLQIAIRSEEWGPADAAWMDPRTIEFHRLFPLDAEGLQRKTKARLHRTAQGWTFEPLEP